MKPLQSTFLALVAAAILGATDVQPSQPVDLTVHEWGTFTSIAGADGAPVSWDALGCTSELTGIVNDYG